MKIGNKEFKISGHTYIMGILNITPDSFSDGGKYNSVDKALYKTEQMIADGMDVLDIGGESSRPDALPISDEEEIARVMPIIECVKKHFDVPISLDTYKSKVAEIGIKSGVDLINDIWGLKYDRKIADIIAEYKVPCCLMHNRKIANYGMFWNDVLSDMQETLKFAHNSGISDNNIILDVGVGFGKTYEQNLESINRLEELASLGYPMLLGASRKSVIGNALNLPVEDRIEGTITTSVFAVMKNCMFVRVHDIKPNYRAIKMAEAIRYGY